MKENGVVELPETMDLIKSTLSDIEGPSHHWLNCVDESVPSVDQDGIFLVLVNAYVRSSTVIDFRENVVLIEKVKLIQKRFPNLNVLGVQYSNVAKSVSTHAKVIQTILEEFITFPILISDQSITMTNGAHCLLFDGSTNLLLHHEINMELEDIVEVIEKLDASRVPGKGDSFLFETSNVDYMAQQEIIKEPNVPPALRNKILYYPGCVSVDEDGNHIFISDSNHHRIIIADGNGRIMDYIGSSPGFEDGEFESAKLLRPAASFYDDAEDCLYFVDSENNAIRRADIESRKVETVFPTIFSKTKGIWSMILDKLVLKEKHDDRLENKMEKYHCDSFTLPWHMLKLDKDRLVVFNRSFDICWFLDMKTWEIKEVTKGLQNVLATHSDIIKEKVNLLEKYNNLVPHSSVDEFPYGLMSSVANFNGDTIICDAAGHRVLKCVRESRTVLGIEFSNMKVLGLPYWFVFPLEIVCNRYLQPPLKEHLRKFIVLPGRCDISVQVELADGIELVMPLEEECIWRQARGSIAELSEFDEVATSTEKVGVAQQWYDELDNLAFSVSDDEKNSKVEGKTSDRRIQDKRRAYFDCAVNISPGTGEIVVSAVLYLRSSKIQVSENQTQIQEQTNQDTEDETPGSLLETSGDFRDDIFMKPLHMRIRFDCLDHPTATTNKETILTDTMLEVNVVLD